MSPPTRARVIAHTHADRPIWVVSDLHLGDGTPSDVFFGKDQHLIALCEQVERHDGLLIVNGDAIDFHQAFSFLRVLRAHQKLLGTLSRLGRDGRLFYVIGNHDYDVTLFRDLLSFRVCDELHIGRKILVRHGYEYDPYILGQLDEGQWHTVVHHMAERWLGTWLRIPLGEFYTKTNRLAFWLAHKLGLAALGVRAISDRLGAESAAPSEILAHLDFWTWSNLGDSMGIFRPAFQHVQTGPWEILLCGHSHLPGVVEANGRVYANSGSWTFGSTQYLTLIDGQVRCRDWLTGREYKDELYQHMLDGTLYERDFFQWWRENYLGWFRFREGEERRGRLQNWQSYLADHQRLSQLRDLPEPPPPLELVRDEAAER